jgi:hypothetical protein
MIWKQNTILDTLIDKHESKYVKFSAIDSLLEEEFYDEEILNNSADDMIE